MITSMTTVMAVGSIGTNICLKTVSLTCSKAVDLITYFATSTNPSFDEFNILLINTDVKVKINKINQLILEFKEKEEQGYEFKKSITMSISDVDEAIKQIICVLDETKKLKEHHDTFYFNTWSWRKANCTPLIESLKMGADRLDKRFRDLEKVISIVGNLQNEKIFTNNQSLLKI